MKNQTVFRRIEKKYLLTQAQFDALWPVLMRIMQPDEYGRHTICNIYYDTPDYRLIRTSLEKPVYKEKLRLRSYGVPGPASTVFAELKKKYKGVVYKRREGMPLANAAPYLAGGGLPGPHSQILKEIDFFLAFWQPQPKVFLAYDRIALFSPESPSLRVTFDANIRWRTGDVALEKGDAGAPLPLAGSFLMEVKIPDAMPLWMARAFSLLGIHPTSISKYGSCYTTCLLPRLLAQRNTTRSPQPQPKPGSNQQIGGFYCA
ncbi:MAG: polyphosphate polymerase domain-containing protein [Gemmiger sp.]|nr:polyphosphate polymerase domain-containing protein [Gemmiger sp.]